MMLHTHLLNKTPASNSALPLLAGVAFTVGPCTGVEATAAVSAGGFVLGSFADFFFTFSAPAVFDFFSDMILNVYMHSCDFRGGAFQCISQ